MFVNLPLVYVVYSLVRAVRKFYLGFLYTEYVANGYKWKEW